MTREQQLEAALTEVMIWIDNWSPEFFYDAEWPNTHAQVQAALAPQRDTAELDQPVAWRTPNWSHSDDDWIYRDYDDPAIGFDGQPSPNNEPLYLAPRARTKEDWLDEGLQNGWITLEYEDPFFGK